MGGWDRVVLGGIPIQYAFFVPWGCVNGEHLSRLGQ